MTETTKLTLTCIALLMFFSVFAGEPSYAETEGRPKIGLALSGGGAKGLAHIGVLKVLEENGIKVDYITGTSMGAIIGGLYAIGYTPACLERLVLEQNWNYILSDTIPLRNISMEEKREEGRYIAVFPFKNNKIELPKGLINGHNIQTMLSGLCWPVSEIHDFDDFQIPFRCVAADIETGESVVMNSGYLPDALRASMSIPSVFTPVERDGRMLIDGGVARNFPVSELKEMGAEIVIGVDVSEMLHEYEDLNTLADVLLQTINYKAARDNDEQRGKCDILIRPDVSKFEMMGFKDTKEIIDAGETAARIASDKLAILATDATPDSLYRVRHTLDDEFEALYIADIVINGLKDVSPTLVWAKLDLESGTYMSSDQIEEAIERLYGSRYFERVTYSIVPDNYGTLLVIDVAEKSMNEFRLGMRYGTDLKTALLINTTFRNLWLDGSKFSASTILGNSPTIDLHYFFYVSQDPGLGISWDWTEGYLDAPRYENDELLANYRYEYFVTECNIMNVNSNILSYKLGGHIRYAAFRHIVGEEYPGSPQAGFIGFHGSMEINTFDRAMFPRKGLRFFVEAETASTAYTSKDTGILDDPCQKMYAEFNRIDTISGKYSLVRSFYLSHVWGDDIHPVFYVYLGGRNQRHTHLVPFDGMNYLQIAGKSVLAANIGIRYELRREKYITLRGGAGHISNSLKDVLKANEICYGTSVTYSLNSFLGPFEYSLMWSNRDKVKYTHLNVGYLF